MSEDSPQGRLHVVEGLDHVEVLLPPDLALPRAVFWVLATPPALVIGLVPLVGSTDAVGVVLSLLVFVMALGLMASLGGLLARAVERISVQSRSALLVVFGFFAVLVGLCATAELQVVEAMVAGLGAGGLVAALFWLLSRNRTRLRLDQVRLTAQRGWSRVEVPLERLDGVRRVGRVYPALQVGDRRIPASGNITDAELAWLDARVRDQALRRRAALAAQGQDPQDEPRPPAELLARLQRS